MADGWLLDAHPLPDGKVALWVWTEGRARCYEEPLDNTLYVADRSPELGGLEALLDSRGVQWEPRRVRLTLGSSRHEPAYRVMLGAQDGHAFARWLARQGDFTRYDFYGLDPATEQQHLQRRGLHPFHRVAVEGGRVIPRPTAPLDPLPRLKVAELKLATRQRGTVPCYDDPLIKVELISTCDSWCWEGDEETAGLMGLQAALDRLEVDVLLTNGGDSFHLGYLWHRAAGAGVALRLGRMPQPSRPYRRAGSYASYGRVLHRAAARHLWGRLHIDRANSFLFGEGRLEGLMTLARLAGVPLQSVARNTPGTAISAMQIAEAARRGHPVLWRKNLPEAFKTVAQLARADRGGYICDPQVGIHDGVTEIDFVSLYPSLMVHYNISPETLDCTCCCEGHVIPGLPLHFCRRREGIVPATLRPLLDVRAHCKALSRDENDRYARTSRILKWLLVTSFGYTGFRNARYGRIECHEAIQAAAREVMSRSIRLAREAGYEVLHGIVDSLCLRGPGTDVPKLVKRITAATELPLKVEGRYRWIVFLPNRTTGMGALNRYYGLREAKGLKVRGIELRQHSTPPYLKRVQQAMLDALAEAGDAAAFRHRLPAAIAALGEAALPLRRGEVPPAELTVTHRLSRPPEAYSRPSDAALAALQLKEAGIELQPGQRVEYVMLNSREKYPPARVRPVSLLEGDEHYDTRYYHRWLLRCGESLLLPFGWTARRLGEELHSSVCRTASAVYTKLPVEV